jgi:FKBP-type peptidyl-prolyl cis-trans isomerase
MKGLHLNEYSSILSRLLLFGFSLLVFAACNKEKEESFDFEAQKAQDQKQIQEYLAANNLTATQTASGLNYIITQPGTGTALKAGDVVSVHYQGSLLNGTTFDESYDKGIPYTFRLGARAVIPGFEEGVLQLKPGGKATLLIPSHLAYGPDGTNGIDPNTVLRFEVEVLSPQTVGAVDKSIIQSYLASKNITDAVETDSGLFYVSTLVGTGAQAEKGDEVGVHYRAKFLNGKIFEETNPSAPKTFVIGSGNMGKGFEEGVARMRVGEKATFVVPSHLAFGALGSSSVPTDVKRFSAIPPYAVLLYEVELVAIK